MEVLQIVLLLAVAFVANMLPAVFNVESIWEFYLDMLLDFTGDASYLAMAAANAFIFPLLHVSIYLLWQPVVSTVSAARTALAPVTARINTVANFLGTILVFLFHRFFWILDNISAREGHCLHRSKCHCLDEFVSRSKYENLEKEKDDIVVGRERAIKVMGQYRQELAEEMDTVRRLGAELDVARLAERELRKALEQQNQAEGITP